MSTETSALALAKPARVTSIEFWRIAFTLLVMWYHMEFMAAASGQTIFGQTVFTSGSSAVEFFFILAGFTLAMSAYRRAGKLDAPMTTKQAHGYAVDFVHKKVKAILPVMLIIVVVWAFFIAAPSVGFGAPTQPNNFLFKLKSLLNSEWELLFMVGTPFGGIGDGQMIFATNVSLWFLTALIIVGYFYTFLINRFPQGIRWLAPLIGVIGYTFFALTVMKNSTAGMFGGMASYNPLDFGSLVGVSTSGMVKAFAEMSFGVSMYLIYEKVSKKSFSRLWCVVLSIVELYAIYRFFALTIGQPTGFDNTRRLLYIMLIILLSFMNVTALSRFLNWKPLGKIWTKIGHISLAMYISHVYLVPVYTKFITSLKTKYPTAGTFMYKIVHDMCGGGKTKTVVGMFGTSTVNVLGWKDMVGFGLFVGIFAALVFLFIKLWTRFVYRPFLVIYHHSALSKPLISPSK
ncbi:MAG: acyltransferase family protein [Oscillospiraceae bacterium]|jgi:peptidoglycan/LPS O-acetylase OafA/YrhL|nr:acyltransferase family protein [Oscillospiraceae bacterium]